MAEGDLVAAAFNTRSPEFLAAAIAAQQGRRIQVLLTVPHGWEIQEWTAGRTKSKPFYLTLPVLFGAAETIITGNCVADLRAWRSAWRQEASVHGLKQLGGQAATNIARHAESVRCDHRTDPVSGLLHLLSVGYRSLVPDNRMKLDTLYASGGRDSPSTRESIARICGVLTSTSRPYRVCGRGGLARERHSRLSAGRGPEPTFDATAVPSLLNGSAALTGMCRMWQASTLGVLLHVPWYVRAHDHSGGPTYVDAEAVEIMPTLWPARPTTMRAADYARQAARHAASAQYVWNYADDPNILSYLRHTHAGWSDVDRSLLSLIVAVSGGTRERKSGILRAAGHRILHALSRIEPRAPPAAEVCAVFRTIAAVYTQVRDAHLRYTRRTQAGKTSTELGLAVDSLMRTIDRYNARDSGCCPRTRLSTAAVDSVVRESNISSRVLLARIEYLTGLLAHNVMSEIDRHTQMDVFSLLAITDGPLPPSSVDRTRAARPHYIHIAKN